MLRWLRAVADRGPVPNVPGPRMTLSFGDYEINLDRRELRRAKCPVHVQPQVFDLLVYLVQNRDRVVSKDDLIASVWSGRIVSESTLTSRINAARKAVGDNGENQKLIRTIPRKGLRFVGAVNEQPGNTQPVQTPLEQIREQPRKALPLSDRPAIALLPFNNMSGDPEQEYFSDGISEDIITALSKLRWFFVISRNSSFTYKGKSVKVQQVAQELGVPFILEGSVRKAGARVRVTAQLISSANSAHVWADRYDRELTDIFAIQDEITHAIVEQLRVKLLPQEKKSIGQTPTDNVEAYTYYLRGRQFLHRHSKSYYQLARRMFAKAVELDPLYARAYAGIADCDSFLFLHYNVDVGIDNILATSAKALALENGLAEAHASRGLALSLGQRYDEASVEFELTIALGAGSLES